MEEIYFGTYTKRQSQGIYSAKFDPESARLSDLQLVAKETNPTYLAWAKDGYLYSVSNHQNQGGVASFSPELALVERQVQDGPSPCYVALDDKRDFLFSANYHSGQALIYKRQAGGGLKLVNGISHQGSGPRKEQEQSHIHFADLTPDRHLITCDLGTDRLQTYQLDEAGKTQEIGSFSLPAGTGPRHLVFHPVYKHAFISCELNSTVQNLIYQGNGCFEDYQTISTLPQDEAYQGFNAPSAIKMTKDGWFLYVANRGHNSIACYQFILDGHLRLIDVVPSQGQRPRDIYLTQDDAYLLVPHQDSDNVTIFKRDANSGRLEEISHDFQVPEAVCVIGKPQS